MPSECATRTVDQVGTLRSYHAEGCNLKSDPWGLVESPRHRSQKSKQSSQKEGAGDCFPSRRERGKVGSGLKANTSGSMGLPIGLLDDFRNNVLSQDYLDSDARNASSGMELTPLFLDRQNGEGVVFGFQELPSSS